MPFSGELITAEEHADAVLRLLGVLSSDDALVEQGEATGDLVYYALTRGYRSAQAWLISQGMNQRWRKRSSAITTWNGSDAADGGRYVNLISGAGAVATDFLRLDSDEKSRRGGLVQANGDAWGCEIGVDDDQAKGSYFYVKNDQLWLARSASPPSPVYAKYFYAHPAITSAFTAFDMPVDLRWLCVAEAADAAVKDEWIPGGTEAESRVARALGRARDEAKRIVRRTRQPRQFKGVAPMGNHW